MPFLIRRTLLATLALAAMAAPAHAQGVPEQIVNALNKVWGSHPGFRAAHATGVVVEGSFTPSKEAATLSKAVIFAGAPIPITVRFSDGSGAPMLPDGDPHSNPHGMAIKFHLPGGADADVVTNAFKTFPVANGEDFRDLLNALAVSGPTAPKPTAADTFIAGHPSVPKAFGGLATPSSLARETYNGVNAFIFVNEAGVRQPFRFRLDPVAGNDYLSAADAAKQSQKFLMEELPSRLAQGKVEFKLMAQLANPGDRTDNATIAWPADRKLVEMGTVSITKAVAKSDEAQKTLLFLPTNVPSGIEVSDDPLIETRSEAYAVSFSRRSQ